MGMRRAFWRARGRLFDNFGHFGDHFGEPWGGLGRHLGPLLGMQNLKQILDKFWTDVRWASAGCAKPLRHSLGGTDRVWRCVIQQAYTPQGGWAD